MIRATLAAILSFIVPGLGHVLINFQILKGMLIMVAYIMMIVALLSSMVGAFALILLIPVAHIWAAVSAFRG